MDQVEDLHDFWRQESPDDNFFVAVDANLRSGTIVTALQGHIDQQSSILEVGCNVGRNLNHLYRMGYRNLAGVEINPHAVARLRESYPHLADVPILNGPAEEMLPTLADNSYDVVFTMAVLEHIHPDSARVYGEIARVAKRCVLAIEPRVEAKNVSHRQHPWDVPAEYAKYGLTPARRIRWSDLWSMPRIPANYWHPSFDKFDAIVFVPEAPKPRSSSTPRALAGKVRRRVRSVARRFRN